jgi:hypothetical protein
MALIRSVTVGIRVSGSKIQEIVDHIPAEWVVGDKDALSEIYDNQQLRSIISVAPGQAVWAKISKPYEAAGSTRIVRG